MKRIRLLCLYGLHNWRSAARCDGCGIEWVDVVVNIPIIWKI